MGSLENLTEAVELMPEILEETPEQCQSCPLSQERALSVAQRIVNGEITLEDAKLAQSSYFDDCHFGYTERDHCRKGIIRITTKVNPYKVIAVE